MNIAINIGLCIACAAFVYLLGAFIRWDWEWMADAGEATRAAAVLFWVWVVMGVMLTRDIP